MLPVLTWSDEEIKRKFYKLKSLDDLAHLLQIPPRVLRYVAFINSDNYSVFYIPKKSGGLREIHNPISTIQILQSKLNRIFTAIHKPHRYSFAFLKNRNIVDNASLHCGKKWVLNLDLENFFPSITAKRVYGLLKEKFHIGSHAATAIVKLCTIENESGSFIPQGAPSSPMLSEMIASSLDYSLEKLSKKAHCKYARYADDITFSCDIAEFPKIIAYRDEHYDTWVSTRLANTIFAHGFEINYRKVRLQGSDRRQEVTGLVVNTSKPNVRRKYIRNLRAMINSIRVHGLDKAQEMSDRQYLGKKFNKIDKDFPNIAHRIAGKLQFLKLVRGERDHVYLKYQAEFEDLFL